MKQERFDSSVHSLPVNEALRAEIRDELAALEKYEAENGSFPAFVRAHYEGDPSVRSRAD
jgi:hypothetical protein